MKVVKIRFKKGVRKKIKETQKLYSYLCEIEEINVGEYVICEVRKAKNSTRSHDFSIGRIEEIIDIKEESQLLEEKPYGFVICPVATDFDKKCREIQNLQFRIYAKYNQK